MKKHHIAVAVIITWLLVSFVPQLSLMTLMGKAKGKGKG